jgi:serine/threonine-protein kinase RsbT
MTLMEVVDGKSPYMTVIWEKAHADVASKRDRRFRAKELMASERRVKINSPADIVVARGHARAAATEAGFSICDSTLITTAISEVTRNILEYANHGEVTISILRNGTKNGVKIVASDLGPGIDDISRVMQDGYSSRKGMGMGLPGTKRLMDEFEIRSKVGKGTTITMMKWNR